MIQNDNAVFLDRSQSFDDSTVIVWEQFYPIFNIIISDLKPLLPDEILLVVNRKFWTVKCDQVTTHTNNDLKTVKLFPEAVLTSAIIHYLNLFKLKIAFLFASKALFLFSKLSVGQ